jgi:uncharacterized membrane protein YagU involved in acid resistance
MENNDSLKHNVEDYIETKIDIVKLKAIDKTGSALSGVISGILLAFLGLFVLVFLSFSAAFAVAEITGRNSLGFLAIAVFYGLVAGAVIIFKEKLITMPVINALMKKFYYK